MVQDYWESFNDEVAMIIIIVSLIVKSKKSDNTNKKRATYECVWDVRFTMQCGSVLPTSLLLNFTIGYIYCLLQSHSSIFINLCSLQSYVHAFLVSKWTLGPQNEVYLKENYTFFTLTLRSNHLHSISLHEMSWVWTIYQILF